MSFALRWDDNSGGGFIYLDAVTAYTQNYRGKPTAHPIDAGGTITDHFIRSNPTFRVSAVISGVDISTGTYLIRDLEGNAPYNAELPPNPVSIQSTDQSVLSKFLPNSVNQFLSDQTPVVVIDEQRADLTQQIRDALISLTSGEVLDQETGRFQPDIKLLKLYEYDGTRLTRVINRLVMSDLIFRETSESGGGLFCDFSFEQVSFANLKQTQLPTDVQQSLKKKASVKASKGKQDSTVQDPSTGSNPPEEQDLDPLRQARGN
jgi:hypothetical protein